MMLGARHHLIRERCAQITRTAAQTARAAEPFARALAALVIGVLGALALIEWATPCDAGHLCAAAVLQGRPSAWLSWLCTPLRRLYLQALIASAKQDLMFHDEQELVATQELDNLPWLRAAANQRLAELHEQLAATRRHRGGRPA